MYELDEVKQQRLGGLGLMPFSQPGSEIDCPEFHGFASVVRGTGVFDAKWNGVQEFFAAHSDGNLRIYTTNESYTSSTMRSELRISEKFALATDVSTRNSTRYVTGASDGIMAVLQLTPTGLVNLSSRVSHSYLHSREGSEIWSLACSSVSGIVYSGAESQDVKLWDDRDTSSPSLVIRKCFEAGVCCVYPSPAAEYMLYTGCYDGNIRLHDIRSPRMPVQSKCLHAGPWSIKFSPDNKYVGVACMRAGFLVLDPKLENVNLRFPPDVETGRYEELAYGVDFIDDNLIGASFYDRRIVRYSMSSIRSSLP